MTTPFPRRASLLLLLLVTTGVFAQKAADAEYWIRRGNAEKEASKKIIWYSSALKIDPQNPQTYVWRGLALRAVGKYRASLADFDSATILRPSYEIAYAFRGDSYLHLEAFDAARVDFRKTLELNPINDFAYARLGELERIQKHPQEARILFAQASRINPRNEFALVRQAALCLEAGLLDSAIFFASKTIEISTINDWAWQTRGEAFLKKGMTESAIADFRKAIEKNKLNIQAHFLLAEALKNQKTDAIQREKNLEEAVNLLYEILDREPNRADVRKRLAAIERLTPYKPLRPKPLQPVFRTGLELVEKMPPPMEERPKTTPMRSAAGLPASIDYASEICLPRNQGNQGSCAAFTFAYLAAYHEKKETGQTRVFSPAFLYHLANGGVDNGLNLANALKSWEKNGICQEYNMPYNEKDFSSPPSFNSIKEAKRYKIDASFPIWTLDELKYQLYMGNPLILSVVADQSLWELKEAPWQKLYGKTNGAHAMLVIGYDDDKGAIKVINSWGKNWGENGYGWISYSLFEQVRLQLFVTKDAQNISESEIIVPDDARKLQIQHFEARTSAITILSGIRNGLSGTLDITGTTSLPPMAGYFAQVVVYYFDASGNKIPSQQFPFNTYDGQASHSTNVLNVPVWGFTHESWWVRTPSTVFPFWHQIGAVIYAQPALFVDGFQVALGPRVML